MLRLVIAISLLVATNAESVCHPVGGAGVMCSGRMCPTEQSACVDDECTCPVDGSPELMCAEENDFFASVVNDPKAFTMNNRQDADLPVPCGYLFSSVTTSPGFAFRRNADLPATCAIKIYLHNERATGKGKMFVRGFRITVETTNTIGGDKSMVYKADSVYNPASQEYCHNFAVSKTGGNNFQQDAQKFRTRTPFKVGQVPVTFATSASQNMIKLQVPVCGLSAVLRPADQSIPVADQTWMPGFALKYDQEKNPVFHQAGQVVSLVPDATLSLNPKDRPGTDHITYRAFTGPGKEVTDFPNYSPKCAEVSQVLDACPGNTDERAGDTTKALRDCNFILSKSLFAKCYSNSDDKNVSNILSLYAECVDMVCNNHVIKCMDFKLKLQDLPPPCKAHAPITMVEHPCTFT